MKWVKTYPWLVVVAIFVLVYGFSSARTITGFGDSDELIAAGYVLALPHQPGYPLLTLLVFLVTRIPLLNPAFLAHLMAGLIMAFGLGISGLFLYRIGGRKAWLQVVAASLVAGSSWLLWRHGTHLEVFGLMGLFSMGLLYWAVFGSRNHWLWWGVVAGLGLGHHQLLVLTLVPQTMWLVFGDRRRFKPILLGTMAGLGLTLVGIWLMALRQQPDSWAISATFSGVTSYFLRSYYSGYSMESQAELSAYVSLVEAASVFHSLEFYAESMWRYWGWWNGLAVLGLLVGRKVHPSYWLVVACFFMSGPVLAGYVGVHIPAIVERMYVLSQLYWGLFIGFFLLWMRRMPWMWLVVSIAWLVWLWPTRTLAGYTAAMEYVEGLFADLPPESGLICLSDVSCFGSYYYQSVLSRRTDVLVLPNADQFRVGRQAAWAYGGFDYPDNPFRLGEAIGRATLMNRPIYVAEISDVWIQELGLDGQAFSLVPDGAYRFLIERPLVPSQGLCADDPMCILRQLSFRVWRNPADMIARLQLADAFERYGLDDLAKRERRHAEIIGVGPSQFPDQSPR